MKIIYTINGQESSWCASGRDKYELQRIMNDGVGIPADPMLDVLVFAAYMGEYSSLYSFYQEIVEEFLDPDELFDTEPIEYFNTVLQPMFEDDIKILDITDWDMTENKKEKKMDKMKALKEAVEDTTFDIADRFVAQARRVYNNIENALSEIHPDGELDPRQQSWFDSVYDAFYDLKTGASRLRNGNITSDEFLEYIEQFMDLTEDEDDTNDYQTMWPIRKMFVKCLRSAKCL